MALRGAFRRVGRKVRLLGLLALLLAALGAPASGVAAEVAEKGTAVTYTDGPDASYTLFTWQVSGTDAGNLTVTEPPTATLGQQGTIETSWTGLTAGTRYLGAVRYSDASREIDRTLVSIAT